MTVNFKKYGKCYVYASSKFPQSFIIKIINKFPEIENHAYHMDLYSKI